MLAWLTPERAGEAARDRRASLSLGHALAFSALNRWFLGYPEAGPGAQQGGDRRRTRRGAAMRGQAAAAVLGASLLFFLRVDDTAGAGAMAERSEQCHRLCLQHGFAMWRAYAEVFLGWLMVMRGEDVRRHRAHAQSDRRVAGHGHRRSARTPIVVVLADGCLAAARRLPGERMTARARPPAGDRTGGDRHRVGPAEVPCGQSYQAELHRLRGELLLARDGLAAAEEALECFHRAMQLGREKGALAWELRAAMSLVRLRERQGEAYAEELAEARRCLAERVRAVHRGVRLPRPAGRRGVDWELGTIPSGGPSPPRDR